MYAVIVRLDILPERWEQFAEAIRTNATASLRDEPGCLRFDVLRVLNTPNVFMLYELYRDEAAFVDTHRHAPHFAAWRAAIRHCLAPDGQQTILCGPLFDGSIAA